MDRGDKEMIPHIEVYIGVPPFVAKFIALEFTIAHIQPDHFDSDRYALNSNSIIAVGDKIIAASIITYTPEEIDAWLSYFVVAPHFRRQKVGTGLLEYAKDNNSIIGLECYKDNVAAYNFYLSAGFKVAQEYTDRYNMSWKRRAHNELQQT